MKKFTLAAIVATLSLASFSGVAMANDTDDDAVINGRSEMALVAALTAQGVAVDGVEEWGTNFRVWSTTANGGYSMSLFDSDTLQPISR